VSCVLVPNRTPLAAALERDPAWRVVDSDDYRALLIPR